MHSNVYTFTRLYVYVITSYSIHYTKLYDALMEIKAKFEKIIEDRIAAEEDERKKNAEKVRITSYNVCYTKLLRLPIKINQINQLSQGGETRMVMFCPLTR